MTCQVYFRPAIALLISKICGITFGIEFSGVEIGASAAALVFAACCLRSIHRHQSMRFGPILLFLALGYLSIAPWMNPRIPSHHIIHYTGPERWGISGKIDDRPQHIKDRTRFTLQTTYLNDGRQNRSVIGKLGVTVAGPLPELKVGDRIRFSGRLRTIRNFKNPGAFDYRRYMAFKGIWVTSYVKSEGLAVIGNHRASYLAQLINKFRDTYSALIDRSGDSEAQAVLKALIIGDRTQLSRPTRQSFNRAGLGHLLAISGLHIGIVATVAFVLLQLLMGRIKLLLWRAWSRKSAALLALFPVFIYGAVAGFAPSTQRAVIMVAVFLLTFLVEKEQDALNTLALAALIILTLDPPALYSISFQLSFAAVLAIIYGLSRVKRQVAGQPNTHKTGWFPFWLSAVVCHWLPTILTKCP